MRTSIDNPTVKRIVADASDSGVLDQVQCIANAYLAECGNVGDSSPTYDEKVARNVLEYDMTTTLARELSQVVAESIPFDTFKVEIETLEASGASELNLNLQEDA